MKISISNKADERIQNIIDDKKTENANVRIYIQGMGWGGPTFGIALDEQKQDDYVQEHKGVNYVIGKELIDQFQGFEIDYVKGFLSKGFQIKPSYGGSSCS